MSELWERNAALRARLRGGEALLGVFLSTGSPVVAELLGRSGLDWCLVDLEHGLGGEASLHGELLALELTGTPALVRVESGAPLRIGRVLDHGAGGIMVPRLRSAAEAAEVVSYARYPPAGARGVALSVRGGGYGTLTAGEVGLVDAATTVIIQIENDGAVADAEAIAAIDGVDVLFVGPNDLTHGLGIPGRFDDPRYLAALDAVAAAARNAGKVAGIMLRRSADEAAPLLPRGYRFFALSDGGLLGGAARGAVEAIHALG